MTAKAARSGARPARPQIPYFWWLRESTAPRRGEPGYTVSDTDYIPSSTKDLWRSARRRRQG